MSYVYDAEGHVTEAEDALGNKVFLKYALSQHAHDDRCREKPGLLLE